MLFDAQKPMYDNPQPHCKQYPSGIPAILDTISHLVYQSIADVLLCFLVAAHLGFEKRHSCF
jgi:hypothetical protein